MSARFSRRGPAAFSLVEVALAVGIVSFALVAIFGLLSIGVNGARDSGDDTRVGFIMQDVSARVRAEVASVSLPADPAKMDLTWSTTYGSQLNYTVLSTALPNDSTGQPPASATAYYTADGLLVKQSTATAPTTNYYKASIYIQPLSSYPFTTPTPTPGSTPAPGPYLAVTVKVGWPTDRAVNGSVLGANNAAKSVFTFYLPKP